MNNLFITLLYTKHTSGETILATNLSEGSFIDFSKKSAASLPD